MTEEASVSEEIAAPAERVWAMVSDVTQMGRWSPENEGATWLRGATGPQPGAQFQGVNRNGKKTWTSIGTIVECEPPRVFSFRIKAVGLKVAEWRYEFETTATGCRVTETWVDQRGPLIKALGKSTTGVKDRAAHNQTTMLETLEKLKLEAEADSAPG
ncbi:MAG: SRPBCC family protein [Acidimicrobiales bacterium]|jgi:uncharacterized protein YndB with AHSA1/START domain